MVLQRCYRLLEVLKVSIFKLSDVVLKPLNWILEGLEMNKQNVVYAVITILNDYKNVDNIYSNWWKAEGRVNQLKHDYRYNRHEIYIVEFNVL